MSSEAHGSSTRKRSTSRTRTSRPTTPLRPSSRSSFRESARDSVLGDAPFPLNVFEPAFAELSDAMADLEANMMHFQLMHESLARFSESFASFMYGLNMNAYCVDFPEGPVSESFRRAKQREEAAETERAAAGSAGGILRGPEKSAGDLDGETTFMTTDTSFVDNPPATASRNSTRLQTPKPARVAGAPGRGSTATRRGGRGVPGTRGAPSTRGGRPSGLARARGRGRLVWLMSSVIRYVTAAKKTATGTLYFQCHVKPGASKVREGVVAVTEDAIEICIAAQARDGEANKAVIDVLCRVLNVPKSSVSVNRGAKSRDKTVAVSGMPDDEGKSGELLERVRKLLSDAAA
ncbi:DASH complex subunit dam1 [Sporothrix eucalyptigena]|uniref:DASH complex subunit DAM1 n=1 Tax=Sporothrix eucalyptigena TaxID=1812306 RepID=A0ABP0BC44_9PEZI